MAVTPVSRDGCFVDRVEVRGRRVLAVLSKDRLLACVFASDTRGLPRHVPRLLKELVVGELRMGRERRRLVGSLVAFITLALLSVLGGLGGESCVAYHRL